MNTFSLPLFLFQIIIAWLSATLSVIALLVYQENGTENGRYSLSFFFTTFTLLGSSISLIMAIIIFGAVLFKL